MLAPADATWIQGPVSILIASADGARVPSLAVGLHARVAGDGRITIVVLDTTSRALLDDVRAGHPVAVAFTHSASTRSLQVKARRATIGLVTDIDRAGMTTYAAAIAREWAANGAPEMFGHAFLAAAPGTLVAIEVVPEAVFDQTPGPRAGCAR